MGARQNRNAINASRPAVRATTTLSASKEAAEITSVALRDKAIAVAPASISRMIPATAVRAGAPVARARSASTVAAKTAAAEQNVHRARRVAAARASIWL